ncbi:MAG: MauE/DoxX family redox-associated membrane protein [Actinomycetota bacterium]
MERRRRTAYVAFRLACRLIPAGIFLWAGLAKAFARQDSILAVNAYDVLPERLIEPVAVLLPWAEIALAVLLVLGLFVRVAGLGTALLSAVFIAGLAQAKARGLQIDCGCFGGGGPGSGVTWWDIVRDVPLVLAGAYLALRPRGPLQLDEVFLGDEGDANIDEPEDGDEQREP